MKNNEHHDVDDAEMMMEQDASVGNPDADDDADDDDDDESLSSYDSEAESLSEDNDDDDGSSLGSEMEVEAQRLWDALQPPPPGNAAGGGAGGAPGANIKTPEQILQETLTAIHDSKTTAIKIDDGLVAHIMNISKQEQQEQQQRLPPAARSVVAMMISQLFQDLLAAVRSCQEVRHVILGTSLLQLLDENAAAIPNAQTQLYQQLVASHASTITYWKLGSSSNEESMELCGIPTKSLLACLNSTEWPALTEFQVCGIALLEDDHDHDGGGGQEQSRIIEDGMVPFLQKTAATIKLFNWLGIVLYTSNSNNNNTTPIVTPGLFDSLWRAVEPISQLDEVQLQCSCCVTNITAAGEQQQQLIPPPLISHEVLEHLLKVKPKWWRMRLDGMGLDDGHLQIIGRALQANKDCKMNDLLSICGNPKFTEGALSQLYHVCLNKARMGLVHSDDPTWVATFDLVRPLNNLHRRLEYKEQQPQQPQKQVLGAGSTDNDVVVVDGYYQFTNVDRWLEWLQVLSNLPWIDEKRKLNYIWFTLLEQPEMIQSAILALSNTTTTTNTSN